MAIRATTDMPHIAAFHRFQESPHSHSHSLSTHSLSLTVLGSVVERTWINVPHFVARNSSTRQRVDELDVSCASTPCPQTEEKAPGCVQDEGRAALIWGHPFVVLVCAC